MKWLLNFYPPAWQRRYRTELENQLEAHLPTFRTALDLIAGAVDAWLNPRWSPEDRNTEGAEPMITASRCKSIDISKEEALRGAAWMIGLCFVLTAAGVALDNALAACRADVSGQVAKRMYGGVNHRFALNA